MRGSKQSSTTQCCHAYDGDSQKQPRWNARCSAEMMMTMGMMTRLSIDTNHLYEDSPAIDHNRHNRRSTIVPRNNRRSINK